MSLATRAILATLSLERLRTLARDFDAEHLWPTDKAKAIDNIEACRVQLAPLLDMLLIDELEKACKFLGIDPKAHRREALVERLIAADGPREPAPSPAPAPAAMPIRPPLPQARPLRPINQ